MKYCYGIFGLIIFFLSLSVFGQTDSSSKKRMIESTKLVKAVDKKNKTIDTAKAKAEKKLKQKKKKEQSSSTNIKGEALNNSDTITPYSRNKKNDTGLVPKIVPLDSMKILKGIIVDLKGENDKLKYSNDTLKLNEASLTRQKVSIFENEGDNSSKSVKKHIANLPWILLFISICFNILFFFLHRRESVTQHNTTTKIVTGNVKSTRPTNNPNSPYIVNANQSNANQNIATDLNQSAQPGNYQTGQPHPSQNTVANQNYPTKPFSNQIAQTNAHQTIHHSIVQTQPFSNIASDHPKDKINKGQWLIVGASVIGKSHVSSKLPCQDSHFYGNISEEWGIAITSDGAGSADNSALGSDFVVKKAFQFFKEAIISKGYLQNLLPDDKEWDSLVKILFKDIYLALEQFSKKNHLEISSLACTLIVVIYSPIGLLVAHVGDGRAGYCDLDGGWHPLITPHKGEEANQTIFLTSPNWLTNKYYVMSGVQVPESRVVKGKVAAFTIMSDGCETHSFECSKMDASYAKWHDPNQPFHKFFNPLVANLKAMNDNNVLFEEISQKWQKFVVSGTAGLKEESDDKTLILGILL